MGDLRSLQYRRRIDQYFPALVVVCAVVVLLGGALVYTTHIDPETETRQQATAEWETNGELSHSATVVNGTTVFPTGTTLSDRSVYYTRIAPTLDIGLQYDFLAPGGEVTVDGESTLVLRSVDDNGNVLWRSDERLDSYDATLAPGESLETTVSVDVPELTDELASIENELGAAVGTTEIDVEHSITAETRIDGETRTHSNEYSVDIDPGSDVYAVETESTGSESHQLTEEAVTERTYGTLRRVSGPLLLVIGLLAGLGFGAGRYRGVFELTDAERKSLEFAESREALDDWISRARVGERSIAGEAIHTDTLGDLVDIAIDTDERVIEDPEQSRYYVFGDSQQYVYEPDAKIDVRRFGA